MRRENVFGDVPVEKLTFLHYKNMLGKWQNLHLSKVLVGNLKFLYVFFVGKIGRVKVWGTSFR